jgi:hypothetical protein
MKSSESTRVPDDFAFVTHQDTRHLRWATTFASLIAFTKRRDELIPSDLLVGINVANSERVSAFWPLPENFDDFVAEHCDWSEPRWLTWLRWDHESLKCRQRFQLPFTILIKGKKLGKRRLFGTMFKPSPEWKQLFVAGERLTPHKVVAPGPSLKGRVLPLLTPEIMLLAFIQTDGLPLGNQLRGSGLMVGKLEEAAMRSIEKPETLMF